METPSSTRRVTRSQTLSVMSNSNNDNNIPISRKVEDSEKGFSKSKQRNGIQQQDRSALIDITNDSPIVGLATGNLETPSSTIAKQRNNRAKMTPGSGEALLRGQVKTLLQKVEEEAELSKLSLEGRPFPHLQGFVNSPMGLLAPTPANTPQILNLSADQGTNNICLPNVSPSLTIVEEQLKISQVVIDIFDGKKQESLETEKSLITRSLLLDFSEKSESPDSSECSSVLTYQGGVGGESEGREKSSTDDDDASVWSIQVNASTHDEDEEEAIEEVEEEEDYHHEEEGEEEEDGGLVDELCEGMNKMSVDEKMTAKFIGKHTRFVYNSDDEIVEGEEVGGESPDFDAVSPGIMRLRGLPTPKGKHLRFHEEEENN
ncbi:hypothetical protein L1049_023490 [Liquidambar formosana]|uniref:Chalcone-flavanone isomerase family protein n=1 Tax=Liquidambar formosana TaxID=63359 RepID=A0AAP0WXR2_LIQFO